MNSTRIIHTSTKDPWWNLAVEEFLLERAEPGQSILYLWQNQNTVVIGRNQNPWRECRSELLESEEGRLARRLSGGGAVFHDLGNLNFTFIASKDAYNLDRQMETILNAVKSLGINAVKSGRNDLTADGRKFSGNAFYIRGNKAYHHGTILVSADFDKMARYLQVSEDKMRSKGIKSVQSRVVNLAEFVPGLTADEMAKALTDSYRSAYGSTSAVECSINDCRETREAIEGLYARYSSWDWRYGETTGFDVELENRFAWGGVEIGLKIENGLIKSAAVFSDAMEEAYIAELPDIFSGCPYDSKLLAKRLTDALKLNAEAGQGEVRKGGAGMGGVCECDAMLLSKCISQDTCRQMTLDLAEWLRSRSF